MDDTDLAASLVREAGRLAASMLADGLTTEHKTSVSDVVSAADRACEALVTRRLTEQCPADAIVGEEGAAREGTSGRTWYIDPVDGTYNFLSGLSSWCSAVALDDAVGAVFHPSAGELWVAGSGSSTTCNGAELPQLVDRPYADVSVASYLHPTTLHDATLREPLLRVIAGAATVRMLGSGSVELAAVAAGRLGAYVQSDSLPWDWLPGAALVRGAGGATRIVERAGRRWHIAGNRQTVTEIAELLTRA